MHLQYFAIMASMLNGGDETRSGFVQRNTPQKYNAEPPFLPFGLRVCFFLAGRPASHLREYIHEHEAKRERVGRIENSKSQRSEEDG